MSGWQFTMTFYRLSTMDDNEQRPDVQSPLQRTIVVASIACFVSSLSFYWIARRTVELLEVDWVQWLVYGIIPITVTFIILYRSCWHPEITGAARTGSLLLLSCVILGGVLLAIGVMLAMLWFCLYAVSSGPGPG
jgi:hypothetical protein